MLDLRNALGIATTDLQSVLHLLDSTAQARVGQVRFQFELFSTFATPVHLSTINPFIITSPSTH